MFTIFTTPKAFDGHFGVIQTNAIRSWTRLHPACQIIIFGDEAGAAETARLLDVQHVSAVQRNEYGTPLVSGLFKGAKQMARNPILIYVNADIILMSDFRLAVEAIAAWRNNYLVVGLRHNAEIRELLSFEDGWEERLKSLTQERVNISLGIDCLAFPKELFDETPHFAIGRANWDNWPLFAARQRRAAVVDVTPAVTIIHQSHDYSHLSAGREAAYSGPEAERNKQLLGGSHKQFTVFEATHVYTKDGVKVRCRSCYPACVCSPDPLCSTSGR
jgi:hypothetical protein